jgi:hypothetical protein
MLIRLIVLGFAGWLFFRLVRKLLGGGAERRGEDSTPGGPVDEMVQDPVCGTYVPIRDGLWRAKFTTFAASDARIFTMAGRVANGSEKRNGS